MTIYKNITVTDWIKEHDELKKYSSVQIGKVLNKLGMKSEYKKIMGSSTKVYYLPVRQSNIDRVEKNSV